MSDYQDRETRQQAINYATLILRDSTSDVNVVLQAAKQIENYINNGDEVKAENILLEE